MRVTFLPAISTVPVSGVTLPAMVLSTVDFPAPLEPIIVTKSPLSSSRLTSASAIRSLTELGKNVLLMFLSLSIGGLLGRCARRRDTGCFGLSSNLPLRNEQRNNQDNHANEAHIAWFKAY